MDLTNYVLGLMDTGGPPITQTKITNMVSTTTIFGLCTCKWKILVLVGDHAVQSHKKEFHVTWFFQSPTMRVRPGPSVNV